MWKRIGVVLVFSLLIASSVYVVINTRQNILNNVSLGQKLALYRSGEDQWNNSKELYRGNPNGKKIFMLGWGFTEFNNRASWNYTTTPFLARILSVTYETGEIKVRFKDPVSMPYVGLEQTVRMVDCARDNSFLTIENPKKIYGNISFYEYVASGDEIVSFCLNKECTEAGIMCKLYKTLP